MKEKIAQVLKLHFKQNNETLERLKNLLKEVQEDKQKILRMFMEFFKDDIKNGNSLLEELFKDIKTKYSLAPDLSHLLITKKLYQQIYGEVNQNDQYAFDQISKFVKEYFPNFLAIVKNSVDSLGEDIDLDYQNYLINLLKQYELNDIQKDQVSSNSSKEQENAIYEEIQRQDFEALKKSLDNAIKDIQEMNCTTIKQYFFVSAEIQWIQQQHQNKFQSFNAQKFPRTFQLIKLIQSRKQCDPEVIKAFDEMKNGKDVKRNILVLKKRICGIDFNELFRMLAEARSFQKQQMQIIEKSNKNKKKVKAVSFFGLSKVGKSTLIKSLMGYKMKQTRINGINTIQVSNPQQIRPEHENLLIGASNKSTTRIPRLYLLPTNNSEQEDIYLFDCPGAEDSESIEVEISNRITTIEALKQVDELYIAIVISEKIQGLNGEGYEKLARAVDGFVKNYKDIKQSIIFIFNGGSEDYLETFSKNIQDIRANIKNRNNYALSQNFEAFFDHLESQSKKRKQMYVVDPLKLKAEEFVEQIPTRGIRNCEDVLDGTLGQRYDKQFEQCAQKLEVAFAECFENEDIDGASYYFAILQKIAQKKKLRKMIIEKQIEIID